MRIAIIAPLVAPIRDPQLGGSQVVVADLSAGLTGRGHEVDVYAASGSVITDVRVFDTGVDSSTLAGLRYRVGVSTRDSPDGDAGEAAFSKVYTAVRRRVYDVVHNHAFDPPAVRLATGLPFPVVHSIHLPPDRAMAAAIAAARRSPNPPTIAGVSPSQAAAWEPVAPLDAILPDGVPVERIPWSTSGGERVIFAGRFSPEKGAADAIEIARLARVCVDVYGESYDPEYAAGIWAQAGEEGVAIHGAVPRADLWSLMARARAVLCPVKWDEPFGMVAAEAQAAGTPVIAYRRGALPQVVLDGATGFVVRPDDAHAAARALAEVARIRRAACRNHAATHLDLNASLDAHERLYVEVASAGRALRRA
jgi:glycosyltransferase involved in cell wall biosynthesis